MMYSEMSLEQRQVLLDDPENYPMRVAFLGKVGLLSFEEVDFLRQNGVDFEIDDRQAAEILAERGAEAVGEGRTPLKESEEEARRAQRAAREFAAEAARGRERGWSLPLLAGAAAIIGLYTVLRRVVRMLRG